MDLSLLFPDSSKRNGGKCNVHASGRTPVGREPVTCAKTLKICACILSSSADARVHTLTELPVFLDSGIPCEQDVSENRIQRMVLWCNDKDNKSPRGLGGCVICSRIEGMMRWAIEAADRKALRAGLLRSAWRL